MEPIGVEQLLPPNVDISEIRDAEQAQQQTETRYRRLFSTRRNALLVAEIESTKLRMLIMQQQKFCVLPTRRL